MTPPSKIKIRAEAAGEVGYTGGTRARALPQWRGGRTLVIHHKHMIDVGAGVGLLICSRATVAVDQLSSMREDTSMREGIAA